MSLSIAKEARFHPIIVKSCFRKIPQHRFISRMIHRVLVLRRVPQVALRLVTAGTSLATDERCDSCVARIPGRSAAIEQVESHARRDNDSRSLGLFTSTRWRTPRIPAIRRNCWTRLGRGTWSTAGPPTRMTQRRCRAGARLASRKSRTPGTLYPKRMETVDDEIRDLSFKFMDKAKADGKPFFVWLNPTRMHIVTHLSPKYEAMRNSKNGWTIHEAGMAQLDDDVGMVPNSLPGRTVDRRRSRKARVRC